MSTSEDFESYIVKGMAEILKLQKVIIEKQDECNKLIANVEGAMIDYKDYKKIAETENLKTSRLATLPPTLSNIPLSTLSINQKSLNMADKMKYSEDYIRAYETINKFYDYKSNDDILRGGKFSKYPRFLCRENANPELVLKLFTYGFIDKIIVDESLFCISKLPSLLVESVRRMMEGFGAGTYGIQIFDASTDLVGKPLVICQIFKTGRKTLIEGDNTSLNQTIPCELNKFQEWLSNKRAIGLITIKNKLEDMIKARRACIIGTEKGGDIEEMITIYYNHDILTQDTMGLNNMLERVVNLKHKHAKETIEEYGKLNGQRKRSIISIKPSMEAARMEAAKEGSSNPFA